MATKTVDESEIDWDNIDYGNCAVCDTPLEESVHAISDVCDGCRPAYLERWEQEQDAEAERRDEARRYPEKSDDDYRCRFCGYELNNNGVCDDPYCGEEQD